jgi:hypothetical protein
MGNDNHVVVSHKLCGFQGSVGGRGVLMKEPVVIAPEFRSNLLSPKQSGSFPIHLINMTALYMRFPYIFSNAYIARTATVGTT